MRQKHPNKLVGEYLNRLESAAAGLGRGRRTELVAEIREHVDDGLREAGAVDEVAVRNVLERLGPPEEIAAAAGPPPTRAGRLELAAMITLALPFVGWIIGVVLVRIASLDRTREGGGDRDRLVARRHLGSQLRGRGPVERRRYPRRDGGRDAARGGG